MNGSREVIVLGATGYVGGRLVSKLLEAGNKVRVLTRSTGRAERYEWSDRVQMFTGDVLEPDTLAPALGGLRRRLLPRPLDRHRRRLRRDRGDCRSQCARRGRRRRIAPDRVPRWHGER